MNAEIFLFIQGGYYLVTSLWPFVHMRSFEKITGDKKEHWLVYSVSLMLLSSSFVFLYAGITNRASPEVLILAISNCLALASIDIYFSLKGIVRKIYLADALVELIIFFCLVMS